MKRFSATIRIAFGLTSLSVSLLLAADWLGIIRDDAPAIMRGRSRLCESVAVDLSLFASRSEKDSMETSLRAIAKRNPEIISIGLRRADGEVLVDVGDHTAEWRDTPDGKSTETNMRVPIVSGNETWGTVEVLFEPIRPPGPFGWRPHPLVLLILFFTSSGVLVFYLFLRRVLQQLNPARVVPARVRSALDALAEGLVILDQDGRIVLANKSFSQAIRRPEDRMLGSRVSDLPWKRSQCAEGTTQENESEADPWMKVLDEGSAQVGNILDLQIGDDTPRTFLVNSSPVKDENGKQRGVLASFDDVTQLEAKKAELQETLNNLQASSEEIRRQNRALEFLARQDPLTQCCNRRSFFEQFETIWKSAGRYNHALSCLLIDIDHFKLVNDNHGHSTGDQVLQKCAAVLKSTARDADIVCRYGGEEFTIVLPHVEIEDAVRAAEKFRAAIENTQFPHGKVTISVGVSSLKMGAGDPRELLTQSDKALYAAKRMGRNQVAQWDQLTDDVVDTGEQLTHATSTVETKTGSPVPFQAVTALISALAYRDQQTAEHSRRVADLCVIAAEGLMSLRECYILENAALLHDIGKIGVPDCILLKPDSLTADEWKIMHQHDRIGVEIIRASFRSKELTEIIENHHAFFGGNSTRIGLPTGNDIPLGARMLSIADAYDAMLSDRVYRKGRSQEEAFAELQRCAGSQFDPVLVEHFIQRVKGRGAQTTEAANVSIETALSIGLQIERLASALDQQDVSGLQAMASRLKETTAKLDVTEIADKAAELEASLNDEEQLMTILSAAGELMDLCRSTQYSYVRHAHHTQALSEDAAELIP